MCIIIGNVHQFIGDCLIPLDSWDMTLTCTINTICQRNENCKNEVQIILSVIFLCEAKDLGNGWSNLIPPKLLGKHMLKLFPNS